MNTRNEESKNIAKLDQEAEDLIGLVEYLSPNMVSHDGSSAPRQYYESIKKKKGRMAAIGALKVIINNHNEIKETLDREFAQPIRDEICARKKKSQKGRSAQ